MKFVIIGYDGPEGEAKRRIHRSAHLANLEPLDKQGRIILAGPLTDKTGSLLVLEFETLSDAEQFAHSDPYTVHGVFERVEIHPFLQVLPKLG
ncbi:MAG: YciI family protein [Nitrospiraceae bacterium]